MAEYADLLPDVRAQAFECPEPTLERFIRRAVIEFCKGSRVWRKGLTIDLVVGQSLYPLDPGDDGRVDEVSSAIYVTDKLRRKLRHEPHGDVLVSEAENKPGEPRLYAADQSGALRIFPEPGGSQFKPDENPRVKLLVVVVPNRNSEQFPDHVFEQFYDGLVAGALWRLLSIPEKPWTNLELAQDHRHQFFDAIRNARQSATADGWAPMRPKLRRWV